MRKNRFTTALLAMMIAALMLITAGCSSEDSDTASADRIAQLEQENAELKAQLDELTAAMDRENDRLQRLQEASLKDWTLDVSAWADGNGATVTFTATPDNYAEGQKAALSVRMGDLEAESTNCVWDGTSFTGSLDLSAADGYSYYCILTDLDGTQEEVELNSPDNITNETLVYLGSSLTAYANLVVENWEVTETALNITSGYIQVQMPRLALENAVSATKAELVLHLNGQEVSRQDVALTAGEGDSSYEAAINNTVFTMPAMEDDYQLDLWLEVTLSNGTSIRANGGSWYNSDGQLQLVVG